MKTTNYNLEESLGYVVGRARRAIANRLNHNFETAGHDVTCEQWAILMNLSRKDRQSQRELADCSCKDKTSITRLLDGLERRSLVVRTHGTQDARQKIIQLTPQGKKLQAQLLRLVKQTLLEAQAGIKAGEIAACKEVLKRISQNLA